MPFLKSDVSRISDSVYDCLRCWLPDPETKGDQLIMINALLACASAMMVTLINDSTVDDGEGELE